MCAAPGWKPQFSEKLSEMSETAAYAAALSNNLAQAQAKEKTRVTPGELVTVSLT